MIEIRERFINRCGCDDKCDLNKFGVHSTMYF